MWYSSWTLLIPLFLLEFAELVLIHKDFLILSTMDILAKVFSCRGVSNIGHVLFNTVIQLATMSIEDMHIRNPPVVTKAIKGPYSRICVQGPLEERLEIFCGGVFEESLRGFIDLGAESYGKVLAFRSPVGVPVGRVRSD